MEISKFNACSTVRQNPAAVVSNKAIAAQNPVNFTGLNLGAKARKGTGILLLLGLFFSSCAKHGEKVVKDVFPSANKIAADLAKTNKTVKNNADIAQFKNWQKYLKYEVAGHNRLNALKFDKTMSQEAKGIERNRIINSLSDSLASTQRRNAEIKNTAQDIMLINENNAGRGFLDEGLTLIEKKANNESRSAFEVALDKFTEQNVKDEATIARLDSSINALGKNMENVYKQ